MPYNKRQDLENVLTQSPPGKWKKEENIMQMYYMDNALLRYNQLDVASYLMENAISCSLMKFKAPQNKLKKTKA